MIYIVWFINFHGGEDFSGAFSTQDKAQAYIDRFGPGERGSMRVEAYPLDDE